MVAAVLAKLYYFWQTLVDFPQSLLHFWVPAADFRFLVSKTIITIIDYSMHLVQLRIPKVSKCSCKC